MRPRKQERHLPSCVYHKHGAYYLVKEGKWRRLGSDLHTALLQYATLMALPTDGLPALIDRALPAITAEKSQTTRTQYEYCAKQLKEVFAEFRPEQVNHGVIVQMMDAYSDRKAIANRMLTVLRLTYAWALDRGIVQIDPTVSVKRFTPKSRDRLITPAEYTAIYAQCAPWLQIVMDMCYLTGQRIGDVLKIEYSHLLDEGIFVEQQKTGKKLIVGWTPELRAVVARAKDENTKIKSMRYLLAGRAGKMRLPSNVWRCFKDAANAAGVEDVTLHDLRAMAGTEAERQGFDPTALLGHTDRRTTQIYLRDRNPKVVSGPGRSQAKKAG